MERCSRKLIEIRFRRFSGTTEENNKNENTNFFGCDSNVSFFPRSAICIKLSTKVKNKRYNLFYVNLLPFISTISSLLIIYCYYYYYYYYYIFVDGSNICPCCLQVLSNGGIGFGIKREIFFLNLEDGYFGCQVNESTDVLQLYELSKLCDGTPNCFMGSDELRKELKCTGE